MNRTFLLWQEADISKVGGQSFRSFIDSPSMLCYPQSRDAFHRTTGPHTLTASGKDAILRDKNRRLLKGTRCRYMTV